MLRFSVARNSRSPALRFLFAACFAAPQDISEALEKAVGDVDLSDRKAKDSLKSALKAKLQDRYKSLAVAKSDKMATGVKYFFKKLKF